MKLMALELDDKDMMVIRFLITLLKKDNFEIIFWIAVTRNQILNRAFPWKFF